MSNTISGPATLFAGEETLGLVLIEMTYFETNGLKSAVGRILNASQNLQFLQGRRDISLLLEGANVQIPVLIETSSQGGQASFQMSGKPIPI